MTWARRLLGKIGAPETPANVQFVYDWEKSEGGGGKFNPLNQGPVPGHPELTSTGPQFGGGAADYVSWGAGLQGASDYLHMPNFTAILGDLRSGRAEQARSDLIASPWAASHYGGGAAFSDAPVPGHASALKGGAGGAGGGGVQTTSILGGLLDLPGTIAKYAVVGPVVLAGGALIVLGGVMATGAKQKAQTAAQTAAPIVGAAAL